MDAFSGCLAWANTLKQVLIKELEQGFLHHPTSFCKFKGSKLKPVCYGEYSVWKGIQNLHQNEVEEFTSCKLLLSLLLCCQFLYYVSVLEMSNWWPSGCFVAVDVAVTDVIFKWTSYVYVAEVCFF